MGRQVRQQRMKQWKRAYQGKALSIPIPKPKTAGMIMGGIVSLALMIGCLIIIMAM